MGECVDTHDACDLQKDKRILLISYPRTASNLLLKMMSLERQPRVISNRRGGYYFWDAFMKGRATTSAWRPVEQWTDEDIEEMQSAFQQSCDNLESESQVSKLHGKIFFAKEHAQWLADPSEVSNYLFDYDGYAASPFTIRIPDSYETLRSFHPNNFTVLPDDYLETWTVTFLIRHPALAFPSFYRAMMELEKGGFARSDEFHHLMELNATLRWTRLLYDWCSERKEASRLANGSRPRYPLLLDAHDITHDHRLVMKYCELLGMDPTRVQTQWDSIDPQSSDEPEVIESIRGPEAIMLSTLRQSRQSIKDKTPHLVDISLERKKWNREFGEEVGEKMTYWVKKAMPDYDYLRSRRLRCEDV
ncbi:hypothetical protein FE257_009274 [Aspergillus nanangensis]|uniref:Uncharacterized protein n=1 Tax=Aspergillus nanangensis TaxID=2582783 RepID=A0AAD4CLV2_ASPNN|nr:hypothetical protein FE257_009274 [Aspergillus nanangensis]